MESMLSLVPIFALAIAAPPQQVATPSVKPAVSPQPAGVFHPATGLVKPKQNRIGTSITYNNSVMSSYYMNTGGPDQELIDNFILTDTDGTGAEAVDGMKFVYCSSDSNPSGISKTITVYDESIYCQGPTNWPVADCAYQVAGLPGGNNGALACWIVTLDLAGVECNLTDGHGGHAGWGHIWDNANTGPWLAGGGLGQTPTFTWYDHSAAPGNEFLGCFTIGGTSATGFNMVMYTSGGHGSGMTLQTTGAPGGPMTFDVAGATPNGLVGYFYAFGQGSNQVFNPITGNTITTGLANAGFERAAVVAANGMGAYSYPANVPAAAAGLVSTQAIDATTDALSNVVDL